VCVWHADPDDTEKEKTVEALREARADPEKREVASPEEYEFPLKELLDDAALGGIEIEIENHIPLNHVSLRDAKLYDADLTDADLLGADLTDANLCEADLTDADFEGAKLENAMLYAADLTDAYLKDANLAGANFHGTNLAGVNLTGAYLPGADLIDAHLPGANLTDARLTDVDLREANLRGADFTDADLTEANLTATDCEDAEFEKTFLVRASLENADLVGTNFSGAYLFGTRFDGAQISGRTQIGQEDPIGNASTSNCCRYDTDAEPDGAKASISMDEDEIEEADESPEIIRFRRGRSVYRRLEELARQNGYLDLQSEMFVRRREMRRRLLYALEKRTNAFFTEIQRWIFNYGESFRRIFSISAVAILIGWFLYMTTGTVRQDGGGPVTVTAIAEDPYLIVDTLLHSILVFFAGNRVLETTGRVGEAVVVAESVVGPILIALLIFVLGRRAAR